jgi:hypothetical protein
MKSRDASIWFIGFYEEESRYHVENNMMKDSWILEDEKDNFGRA